MSEPQPMISPDSAKTSLAVYLSLAEIVIGSFVHGLKVPLGGHFLSLNQGFFLCRSLQYSRGRLAGARSAMEISGVSALLKSLSPAGQKIGPMMSISAQGGLFGLGLLIAGTGLIGQSLAMVLLSVWAFVQPFVGLLILYGNDLIKALLFFKERLQKDYHLAENVLIGGVIAIVAIKALLGVGFVYVHHRMPDRRKIELDRIILKTAQRLQHSKFSGGSIDSAKDQPRGFWMVFRRQVLSPLFLVSFGLIVVFLLATETSWVQVLWKALRPLAILFIFLFLLTRRNLLSWLRTKLSRHPTFAAWLNRTEAVAIAIQQALYGGAR